MIFIWDIYLRIFRLLHGRYWEPRLRFLETARRALQDVLYNFFRKKNKITQVILIFYFVSFLESLIHHNISIRGQKSRILN